MKVMSGKTQWEEKEGCAREKPVGKMRALSGKTQWEEKEGCARENSGMTRRPEQ